MRYAEHAILYAEYAILAGWRRPRLQISLKRDATDKVASGVPSFSVNFMLSPYCPRASELNLRKPAIHEELCSCNEAGVIACQKHYRVGNLFRPPGAAEWYGGGNRFAACLSHPHCFLAIG